MAESLFVFPVGEALKEYDIYRECLYPFSNNLLSIKQEIIEEMSQTHGDLKHFDGDHLDFCRQLAGGN